jgi:hypothetical protein
MPPKKKKDKPKDGWVEELREAEAQAKANTSTSAEPHLRVARSARKLRSWKKCKSAAETGLSIDPQGPLRAQLIECQKQAGEELFTSRISSDMDRQYQKIRNTIEDGSSSSVDIIYPDGGPIFNNLNLLQQAAVFGNVRIFEDVVALGAAIDYPVSAESMNNTNQSDTTIPAPRGTTALVICCAQLAHFGIMGTQGVPDDLKRMVDGSLECAILLVQMGADCQKRLNFPGNNRRRPPYPSQYMGWEYMFRQSGLNGKTAQQMAQLSKKEDLIKAMAKFENKENKIAANICRCGSRLPWRQCHVGKRIGESPSFVESKGKLLWRYSPLAPCFCDQEPKKIHFKCCWIETPCPRYQDDDTGILEGTVTISDPGAVSAFAKYYKFRGEESGRDSGAFLFPECDASGVPTGTGRGMDPKMMRDQIAAAIRSGGSFRLKQIGSNRHGGVRDRVHDMDPDVYAGCIERIDDFFCWSDVHWSLEKAELLIRVKEWNEALKKFCDDKGLTGSVRQSAIEKHQATPYAPCGNPSCNKIETKVKEYLKCSRCKMIAFCSRECQRETWTIHKKICIPA